MRKKNFCKKTIFILGVIFIIINLFWFANYLSYNKYTRAANQKSDLRVGTYYKSEDDGISYTIKKPDYLNTRGNLGSVNEDNSIAIILWPSLFCDEIERYGITLYDASIERGYMIYVDRNMDFLQLNYERFSSEDAEAAKRMLVEMKDQVCMQFEIMKDEFDL